MEHPVSLIDLYPTLVDLCDLQGDTRKNAQGASLDGHSLRPLLEDPENGKWDGPDAALTMVFVGSSPQRFSKRERQQLDNQHWTIRTRRWRYICYNNGAEELYDHDSDAREWTNLADLRQYQDVKQQLRAKLLEMRSSASEPSQRG